MHLLPLHPSGAPTAQKQRQKRNKKSEKRANCGVRVPPHCRHSPDAKYETRTAKLVYRAPNTAAAARARVPLSTTARARSLLPTRALFHAVAPFLALRIPLPPPPRIEKNSRVFEDSPGIVSIQVRDEGACCVCTRKNIGEYMYNKDSPAMSCVQCPAQVTTKVAQWCVFQSQEARM